MPISLRESFNNVKKARPGNPLSMVNLDLYVVSPNQIYLGNAVEQPAPGRITVAPIHGSLYSFPR